MAILSVEALAFLCSCVFMRYLSNIYSIIKFMFSKKATKIEDIFTVDLMVTKGQLISKCLLGVIVSTKKPTKFL